MWVAVWYCGCVAFVHGNGHGKCACTAIAYCRIFACIVIITCTLHVCTAVALEQPLSSLLRTAHLSTQHSIPACSHLCVLSCVVVVCCTERVHTHFKKGLAEDSCTAHSEFTYCLVVRTLQAPITRYACTCVVSWRSCCVCGCMPLRCVCCTDKWHWPRCPFFGSEG